MPRTKGPIYKVRHTDFERFAETFDTLLKYSRATVLHKTSEFAIVQMSLSGDPKMGHLKRELDEAKWRSCGYTLERLTTSRLSFVLQATKSE